ncbi:ABC transporter substrate-binding protein [Rhodopseudomonas palustris]|uniref:ABC transporter substrate-binding protein n=1 Tax=Rhodopseudomonas palustris TaxID=1076 RepID=UPI000E5B7514|nr:ABC transporter substrate-binding protein [Rhodopseudomonas palustris]QLH70500.1 ABC transporter substrate-binding protein [Rhodopseudomonas palustris]RIA03853.1 amino acid ABC transporter substrate-binding protein [Rhodopseudomonas palustris]
MTRLSRRLFLAGSTVALATPALLRHARAQSEPIRIGSLPPLSGGGGPYGPEIADAHRRVVEAVNKAGGVLGREVKLTVENSETNPEAAVRAARKLIDVDRVIAILGTWESSSTIGIQPLAQEANVLQLFTSSSDSVPNGDKKGLAFNFQPLNSAWGVALAKLAAKRGFTEIAFAGPNNDFASSIIDTFRDSLVKEGGKVVGEPFLYNPNQPSYRAEAERLIRGNPPAVFVAGYVNDFTAVYRELIRAGYKGQVFAISFAVGPQFKEAVGAAANGILHGFPVPPIGKDTYDTYLRFVGKEPNGQVQLPYGCAAYDQINVLLLAIESAKSTEPAKLREHIFKITTGPGERATTFLEGAKSIAAGTAIKYDGASSSVDFKPNGMLKSRDFELYEIRDGKDVSVLRITNET